MDYDAFLHHNVRLKSSSLGALTSQHLGSLVGDDSVFIRLSGTPFASTRYAGGTALILKQHLTTAQSSEARDAVQLAHLDSELCWCDPILEFDEVGNESLTHNDITWN
jgi:hypothetical protein